MTELRKRMIECLQLRGFSERTQEAYVRAVRQLSDHYNKSPDLVTEEELRQYFLYIKNVKKYARPTTNIALCGIKFFFQQTLGIIVTIPRSDWIFSHLTREFSCGRVSTDASAASFQRPPVCCNAR